MTQAVFALESDEQAVCSTHPRATDRDRQAFAGFYARFQPRLVRYASHVWGARDADEIAQEALARAYEAIDLNRDERSLWAWLVVVGRNVAADLARARRVCDVGGDGHPHETTVDPRCVEQSVLDSECLSILGVALSALPPSQSRAWWMSVAEGMTPAAIADSLACSPEAVRQALFKSRKRLAAAMAEFCERVGAFLAPVLFFARGHWRSAAQQAVRPAANAALAATMTSVSLLGAIAVLQQAGPNVVQLPAASTDGAAAIIRASHADTTAPPARTVRSTSATRTMTPTPSSATTSAPATSAPAVPVTSHTYVAKNPLKSGKQAEGGIWVDTPAGTYGTDQQVTRGAGQGLVCGRISAINCDTTG